MLFPPLLRPVKTYLSRFLVLLKLEKGRRHPTKQSGPIALVTGFPIPSGCGWDGQIVTLQTGRQHQMLLAQISNW